MRQANLSSMDKGSRCYHSILYMAGRTSYILTMKYNIVILIYFQLYYKLLAIQNQTMHIFIGPQTILSYYDLKKNHIRKVIRVVDS